MELYQLRSFVAIAELGQLTRAAEKLHVTQPALSAQLKALEDELGLLLFDRTSTGMVLTASGKQILASAEKVIAAAQALHSEARTLKGEVSGKARIGTLSDPEFIRLGEFMNSAVERHPLLELELHQEVTGVALEMVGSGELEASYYYGDVTHPEVAGLPLREVIYRVAAPSDWADRLVDASWNEIADLPWILPPPVSTHHKLVHALLHKQGVRPSKVVEADQEAVISSLVVSGLGLALIREDKAIEREQAGEVFLLKDIRLSTRLWFIYMRDRESEPVVQALLQTQRDVWNLPSKALGHKSVIKPTARPAASRKLLGAA